MKITLLATLLTLALPALHAAEKSVLDARVKDIAGKETTLKPYAGKVLLIVNTASQCGSTPQYAGLETLHKKFSARGFAVLGFPCNDFGEQEPADNAAIKQFCTSTYNVTFPLFAKSQIKPGPAQNPVFTALTGPASPLPGDVGWNFAKFLVGRDGKLLKRFDTSVEPDDADLLKALESALAAKTP